MTQELMGLSEVRKLLGVGRQRADQIIRKPDFPVPITRLAVGKIWDGDAVRRWAAHHRTAKSEGDDERVLTPLDVGE